MAMTINQSVMFNTDQRMTAWDIYLAVMCGVDDISPLFGTRSGVLQRINQEEEWSKNNWARAKEYLFSMLVGSAVLDSITLVPVELAYKSLLKKAHENVEEAKQSILDQSLELFKKDLESGIAYYIIDGQNRSINAIAKFFNNEFPLGLKTLSGRNSDGENVTFHGKKYDDLDDEQQEFVRNIELPLIIAESGQIDDFMDALIAKNEGLPWLAWMKMCTKKSWMPYRDMLWKITTNKVVRQTLNKIQGSVYTFDKNGHDLFVSEMLIWMNTKKQPNKESMHEDFFEGRKEISQTKCDKLKAYIVDFGKGYQKIKTFTNVELRNYIMLRYALDYPLEFDKIDVPRWEIKQKVEFTNQYRVVNKALLNEKGAKKHHTSPNGKKTLVKVPGYYPFACSLPEPERLDERIRFLLKAFSGRLTELQKQNVILVTAEEEEITLEEIYANNPIEVSSGRTLRATEVTHETLDIGHLRARNNGGNNSIENKVMQDLSHNRIMQDTDIELGDQ